MMKELFTFSEYANVNSRFPLIRSVLLNLQEGKIFSNADKEIFFIFHKSAFSYLSRNRGIDYFAIVNFFLESIELPNYFHVYDAADELIDVCNMNREGMNVKVRKRIQLKYVDSKLELDSVLPKGYSINRIDAYNFDNLSCFNLLLETKFWKSKEDFLNNGFGFMVNNASGLPVSICYSASVADSIAEIDVATLPDYQNRGLAKYVVAQFVHYCLINEIIANWDCFENNQNSLKTAERIGFKYMGTYNFLSIFNKTRNNETK